MPPSALTPDESQALIAGLAGRGPGTPHGGPAAPLAR